MKINNLKLRNFQGIKELELNFNGKDAVIYGDNATGKTTVFNAVTWLLFDKASTGAKGFTPKTKTADGDSHNLEHSAEAEFIMPDGRTERFCKVYHEVYKKKKGSPAEEFSGHTTDYYINGVPVKEKEYQNAIINVCGDIEKMKLLTVPHYFAENMTWEERRKLLLEICGDIDDMELIKQSEDLSELMQSLKIPGTDDKYYTVDEFKKLSASRKNAINKELAEIPGRIDEAQRACADAGDYTDEQVDEMTAEYNAEIDRLSEKQHEVLRGSSGTEELIQLISDLKIKLEEIKGEYAKKKIELDLQTAQKVSRINNDLARIKSDIQTKAALLDEKQAEHKRITDFREKLIAEYNQTAAQIFDENSVICPTCGREYPPERAEEMRANFNINKSKTLEEINRRGKEQADKTLINRLSGEIEELSSEIKELKIKRDELEGKSETILSETVKMPPVEDCGEYAAVMEKINEYSRIKSEKEQDQSKVIREYTDKINIVREKLKEVHSLKVQLALNKSTKKRIQELQEREKELAAQYEDIEKALYLCDLFIKEKVSGLDGRINERFKNVHFRLFQTQINGGIKEDCEVLIPTEDGRMIPFPFANNAARINAGLEIITTLSEYFGISMPVFIDNAESVTRLYHTDNQTIRLVVSEPDKKLRLELL